MHETLEHVTTESSPRSASCRNQLINGHYYASTPYEALLDPRDDKNSCHLYSVSHYSKHFAFVNYFNLHNNPMRQVPLLLSLFKDADTEA